MPVHIRVGGVWKSAPPKVRVGGTWRTLNGAWVRIAGVWRACLNSVAVISFSTPSHTNIDPGDASCAFALSNAGTGTSTGEGGWTWRLSGASADYDVRVTTISGTAPSGSAIGTWLNLSTTRSWTLSRTVLGTNSYVATVEIRQTVGGAVVASATLNMTATVDS